MSGFSHFDAEGRAVMVDVGDRPVTPRIPTAVGAVYVEPWTLEPTMISVEEALSRIIAGLAERAPVAAEDILLSAGLGRVLAEDVRARVTQPPAAMSAMDGWAVRAADVARVPATLRRTGAVPAGSQFDGAVGPGDAVRIFTGAPVP